MIKRKYHITYKTNTFTGHTMLSVSKPIWQRKMLTEQDIIGIREAIIKMDSNKGVKMDEVVITFIYQLVG